MSCFYVYLKKISNFLKHIDIFGKKTELKMAGHSKYKTTLGGVFTLVLVSLSTLLFINYSSDIVYRHNPTVVFSEIFSPNPEITDFSKETNFFTVGLQYPSGIQFVDYSIYIPQVYMYITDKTTNIIKSTLIPIERCLEANLPSDPVLHDYFGNPVGSNLSDLLCVKDLDQYFIKGSFDNDIYYAMQIKIYLCSNNTKDPNAIICKSPEEIKQKMGFFGVYYMDYLIDPQNFEQPGKAIGKGYYSPLSLGMSKNVARYIATSKVNSNDGFIFNSFNSYTYPTFKEDIETLQTDDTNSGMLMKFVIRKYHNNLIYERSYKKLQNILAEIGGFIQIIYLFFFLLTMPIVSKRYFEKIINTVYDFEEVVDTKLKSYIKSIRIKRLPPKKEHNIKLNFIIDKSVEVDKEQIMKKKLMSYFNFRDKKKKPLNTTFWEFLKYYFGPFKNLYNVNKLENKVKRLKKGKNLIKQKLDISYILSKFYEVDKLKMLILNENQYNLFEYLPKPVILKNAKISLCSSKKTKFVIREANEISKIKKMQVAYRNILKQNQISEMDKKVIDLLDDNLRDILDVILIF